MPDPKPERPDLDDYLRSDDIIDFDDPSVEEAVEQLSEGLKDNISKAQAIFEFVRDQIFHSFQIDATSITLKASEVLEKGHGICHAQAHLLAALMRGAGIPAGLCYRLDNDENGTFVHGYNAIHIDEIDKWIFLDASIKPDDSSTPFSIDWDTLELTANKVFCSHEDPTVYIAPSKRVIKAFRASRDIDELRENLPDKL